MRERARAAHRAQRLSWLLRRALKREPAAWVSTCAWVRTGSGLIRPYVCVCFDPPPTNGLMSTPPRLVLQPEGRPWPRVQTWLDAGVDEAWALTPSTVTVYHRARPDEAPRPSDVHDVARGGELRVPGSGATIDVAAMLGT